MKEHHKDGAIKKREQPSLSILSSLSSLSVSCRCVCARPCPCPCQCSCRLVCLGLSPWKKLVEARVDTEVEILLPSVQGPKHWQFTGNCGGDSWRQVRMSKFLRKRLKMSTRKRSVTMCVVIWKTGLRVCSSSTWVIRHEDHMVKHHVEVSDARQIAVEKPRDRIFAPLARARNRLKSPRFPTSGCTVKRRRDTPERALLRVLFW